MVMNKYKYITIFNLVEEKLVFCFGVPVKYLSWFAWIGKHTNIDFNTISYVCWLLLIYNYFYSYRKHVRGRDWKKVSQIWMHTLTNCNHRFARTIFKYLFKYCNSINIARAVYSHIGLLWTLFWAKNREKYTIINMEKDNKL